MTPRLVLATANAAKVREFRFLLAGLDYRIQSVADYPGLALPPERDTSYAANARQKATVTMQATGAIALGDDSGLEVAALGGRPGPASARYGGPGLEDAARTACLLAELGAVRIRGARFRCVLALATPWGETAVVEGVLDGVLADAPRGTGGFGYDPIFVVPGLEQTLAELAAADKHRVSHRGRAVQAARQLLERWSARARREGCGAAPAAQPGAAPEPG